MHVIIGAYRGVELATRAIASLMEHANGIHGLTVVDDSGRADDRIALRSLPAVDRVVPVADGQAGYNAAMQRVCEIAGDDPFVFWEEDFELLASIDFYDMGQKLAERPHLAQLALLRGPHFPIEHEHGGLLEALAVRLPGSVLGEVDGVIEQVGTFTCNPSVWAEGIAARGWPAGGYSEDLKRDELLAEGYRFGFLPDVRVRHDGERTGFDY